MPSANGATRARIVVFSAYILFLRYKLKHPAGMTGCFKHLFREFKHLQHPANPDRYLPSVNSAGQKPRRFADSGRRYSYVYMCFSCIFTLAYATILSSNTYRKRKSTVRCFYNASIYFTISRLMYSSTILSSDKTLCLMNTLSFSSENFFSNVVRSVSPDGL